MKTYERKIGGYVVRQQLDEADAVKLGLIDTPEEAAPVVETAKATAANKTAGGASGRRIGKRS